MKKFDPAIPRQMFWSNDVGGKSHCPRCFASLENEHHIFVMATRKANDIGSFIVGNNAGYFCPKCPTIVIDGDTFAAFVQASLGLEADAEFTILGLVDLEAVPNEKRSLPLGGDENPIPLVQFSNMSDGKSKRRKATTAPKKKRMKRTKKRR